MLTVLLSSCFAAYRTQELERKRKAAGGGKEEPKLTKKQQEAVQTQLAKEKATRRQLQQLDKQLAAVCAMMTSCFHGNPGAARRQIPSLLSPVTSLLSSPLAAPRLGPVFIEMSRAAFENRDCYLGTKSHFILAFVLHFILPLWIEAQLPVLCANHRTRQDIKGLFVCE